MHKPPRRRSSSDPASREETGFYDAYAGFARTLRLWLIAYGIGGPAAFLTNESAGQKLYASGQGAIVAYFFLSGVVLQIALALIYKSAMWYLYLAEYNPEVKHWRLYRGSHIVSEAYWLEVLGDVVTLLLFGGATLRLIRIFFP